MHPVLLSWSGGKDSALALQRLQADPKVSVVGLLTTVTSEYDRISIHGVRRSLLHRQAAALGPPFQEVWLEPQSSNDQYRRAWQTALRNLPVSMRVARRIAYGDIFLEDVRSYRESLAQEQGYEALFPLWGESSHLLADEVLRTGMAATVVCVDTQVLDSASAGRAYDASFIAELPSGADPCGERGEFHTFVSDGPGFSAPVAFSKGETVLRDERFAFCDLIPSGST